MVAVIETGGKQYCVQPGQTLTVERLDGAVGETVQFQNLLDGNTIVGEIIEHRLGDKVVSRKFRNKTRFQRVKGHRQSLTVVTIKEAEQAKRSAKKESKEEA